MEGIFFFWLFWIFWIITTFFMSKSRLRLVLSAAILSVIILSTYTMKWFTLNISASSLFLLLATYVIMAKQKGRKGLYLFITSFIIMLAFTTFHLYELYDPVWLIFDRNMMLSFLLTYITLLLHHDVKFRIITLICGSIHGEILYAAILKHITPSYLIGSFAYLDVISISLGLLLIINGFKKVSSYFEYQIKHLERGKQKPS
ncbi:hypothetical protein PZE06_05870 [Robertmurraya sp. DFI.2.37]|uniref:YphA family membrane protein n=1 Tax=Robertmurraya sp. DFI.2.37 TaxID=3031819 RepID=UPI0012473A2D|nr:hypothetical protein [Robertmurraya sp. DFI.2.37]MDF1507710.1 hypothetical protein [Robertmurraya sp. DFI.2.37]